MPIECMRSRTYDTVKSFWEYMRPNVKYLYVGILFNILVCATQLAIPFLLRYTLDTLSRTNVYVNNNVLIFLICLTFLLNTCLKLIKNYYFTCFAEFSLERINKKIIRKLVFLPMAFYDKNLSGDLFSRINVDVESLKNIYSEEIATIIYQPLIILFCTADLFYINWKLAGLIIFIILPVVCCVIWLARIIKDKAKGMFEKRSVTNVVLQEILQMMLTIKIFNGENNTVKKYSKSLHDTVKASISLSVYRIFIESIGSCVLLFGMFVSLRYATVLLMDNAITLGQLGEFIICLVFVGNAFTSSASAIGSIQKASGASDRLSEVINMADENKNNGEEKIESFYNSIDFKSVSFSYPIRPLVKVFDNIDLQIRKGEKIGIVGESGCGKSSLIYLLLKFYEVDSGDILINGRNISIYDNASYRNLFSVVSQNVQLFSGTIRDNILYGINEKEDIDIKRVCVLSGCNFIEKLPNGLDTEIGENGVTLSGGQRQRIALARAIIRKRQILILDEATSALDADTEKTIFDDVLRFSKDKTLIVLSHKDSIIRNMDKVYKIWDKKIFRVDNL